MSKENPPRDVNTVLSAITIMMIIIIIIITRRRIQT
jgi:hypothetical protein